MYQRPDGGFLRKYMLPFIHAVSLVALLAGGTIWTIQQQHPKYTSPVALLKLPVAVVGAVSPSEEAFRIGQVLRRYTSNGENADKCAWSFSPNNSSLVTLSNSSTWKLQMEWSNKAFTASSGYANRNGQLACLDGIVYFII